MRRSSNTTLKSMSLESLPRSTHKPKKRKKLGQVTHQWHFKTFPSMIQTPLNEDLSPKLLSRRQARRVDLRRLWRTRTVPSSQLMKFYCVIQIYLHARMSIIWWGCGIGPIDFACQVDGSPSCKVGQVEGDSCEDWWDNWWKAIPPWAKHVSKAVCRWLFLSTDPFKIQVDWSCCFAPQSGKPAENRLQWYGWSLRCACRKSCQATGIS